MMKGVVMLNRQFTTAAAAAIATTILCNNAIFNYEHLTFNNICVNVIIEF